MIQYWGVHDQGNNPNKIIVVLSEISYVACTECRLVIGLKGCSSPYTINFTQSQYAQHNYDSLLATIGDSNAKPLEAASVKVEEV